MAARPDRLPDTTTLGAVRLQVADLERSLKYYGRVLGLELLEKGPGQASLGVAGTDAPLVILRERPGARPASRRGQLGLYHFAILVPDRKSLGRFVSHLTRLGERTGASDHLVSEALYLTDPDGLGIEVYADRPRSAWQWHQGELRMATDPLDLDDLVAAAGGDSWTGMPPGTAVGHMHLHVGDLPAAAAFYQEAVGLEPTVRSYPGALFLSAGGYHHHLGVNTWAGPAARPPAGDDARLLEWTLVIPGRESEAAARRVATAGYPAAEDGGGWRVTDPWGTVLRVTGRAATLDATGRGRP